MIHHRIAQIDLQPRATAAEYKALRLELMNLARDNDNKAYDRKPAEGEVHLMGDGRQDCFVSLRYEADDGRSSESLTVSRTQRDELDRIDSVETLRIEPAAGHGGWKFSHFEHRIGETREDTSSHVYLNLANGTLTQGLP